MYMRYEMNGYELTPLRTTQKIMDSRMSNSLVIFEQFGVA